MKVLLVNGSPRKEGCTNRALMEIKNELEKANIETEIFWIGTKNQECIACRKCHNGLGKCVFNDNVNEFASMAKEADGFIFGTPVYYGSASGGLKSFMDRLFYSSSKNLQNKPAATIVSCRRGGATMAFAQINFFYTINNMPIVPSQYWNQVHGNSPEEVETDLEGLQTMRTLGKNMIWMLNSLKNQDKPTYETKVSTNFIRK